MKKRGLIQIYTGNGKGKTTAALGLACRARGHGLMVCYIYFHKDSKKWGYGEHRVLKRLCVDTFGFAKKRPYSRGACLKGLEFVKKIFQKNKYDILILDEILISLREGYLREKEVLDIFRSKPKKLELVLTGRGATKNLLKRADLVSEVKKIKHPYSLGVKRRKGIEY